MKALDIQEIDPFLADLPSWVALAQLIEDMRLGTVVPFLGAGVSQAVGFPGWDNAVLQLGRVTDPDLKTLPGDPLFLADRFRQAIHDEKKYLQFYDNVFSCDDAKQERIRKSALWQALAALPCLSWITLNYDSALEFALAELAGRHPISIDWTDRPNLNRFLLGEARTGTVHCLHLHGVVPVDGNNDGGHRSFVFTEQEYQQRYLRSDEDRSKLFVVLTSKVMLFVGSSLTDLDLMGVLREVKAKLGYRGHRHYAILAEPTANDEPADRKRDRLRLKYGVECIYFRNDDGRFAGLPALLRFLRQAFDQGGRLPLPERLSKTIIDDPHKGRWGMSPVRERFQASVEVQKFDGMLLTMDVIVRGPGKVARFHLHPTFPNEVVTQPFVAGKAGVNLQGWGAFTIGIEVIDQEGNQVVLEVDLADYDELPWDFRQR
ncbi:MAG TPA: SIR2 family protein [Polyangium sp.]|nr:SIR2 family protein [Polyangium sp.]